MAKNDAEMANAATCAPVKERLAKFGASPIGSSPAELDARIRADYEKWGAIIKASGISAE